MLEVRKLQQKMTKQATDDKEKQLVLLWHHQINQDALEPLLLSL